MLYWRNIRQVLVARTLTGIHTYILRTIPTESETCEMRHYPVGRSHFQWGKGCHVKVQLVRNYIMVDRSFRSLFYDKHGPWAANESVPQTIILSPPAYSWPAVQRRSNYLPRIRHILTRQSTRWMKNLDSSDQDTLFHLSMVQSHVPRPIISVDGDDS